MFDKLQFVALHDEDSIGEDDKLKFVGRQVTFLLTLCLAIECKIKTL